MVTPNVENDDSRLRCDILNELTRLEILNVINADIDSKQAIRNAYESKRLSRSCNEQLFIEKYSRQLISYFADGKDVNPVHIKPKLVPVDTAESLEGHLFRLATYLWSIPVSRGYGRRMRYLVIDSSNNKLMGIFALGDPVLNMKVRDAEIGWDIQARMERLYHVMDAYVLGAMPPYSELLVGKLIALATTSDEVRKRFRSRYAGNVAVISQESKRADLVLITTTSALGRSSIYNRLKVNRGAYFRSLGYTSGYGHFHVSDTLFDRIRQWLRNADDPYADNNRFGQGPNWRMRTLRKAFAKLGINPEAINHGVQRQVFAAPLAENYKDILTGQSFRPRYLTIPFSQVFDQFRERWLLPRAERTTSWRHWERPMLLDRLGIIHEGTTNTL